MNGFERVQVVRVKSLILILINLGAKRSMNKSPFADISTPQLKGTQVKGFHGEIWKCGRNLNIYVMDVLRVPIKQCSAQTNGLKSLPWAVKMTQKRPNPDDLHTHNENIE